MAKVIGKDYDERLLTRKLRNLVTQQSLDILEGKKKTGIKFRQALLLKLAGGILPRINEFDPGDEFKEVSVIIKRK